MPSFHQTNGHLCRPNDVGILGLEVYFPSQYVCQRELEVHDGVKEGKYTIGLGQSKMGFCSDLEDTHSLCLTVLQKLVEKSGIGYTNIGYLGVGTETIIDKSKSIKSVLMQLFNDSGNCDVEGTDSINACYGGTSALFHAIDWVESSAWDGRYAVVVCADIAVYAKGSARPTGGAGAIAMLIGPDASLVIERGVRSSYFKHAYDFYKPDLSSDYPTVDGKLSIECYIQALDNCYKTYLRKAELNNLGCGNPMNIDHFNYVLFHAPFGKLVRKSFARLVFNDFLSCPAKDVLDKYPNMEKFREKQLENSYSDKELFDNFMDFSKDKFESKTRESLLLSSEVGNMYTPSLYGGLASLLGSSTPGVLSGKRIGLFSYGSGLAATMYSIRVSSDNDANLSRLVESCSNIRNRLNSRRKIDPKVFEQIMNLKEANHHKAPYMPSSDPALLFPGTWYLTEIDSMHRRKYHLKDDLPEEGSSVPDACAEHSAITNGTNGHQVEQCVMSK